MTAVEPGVEPGAEADDRTQGVILFLFAALGFKCGQVLLHRDRGSEREVEEVTEQRKRSVRRERTETKKGARAVKEVVFLSKSFPILTSPLICFIILYFFYFLFHLKCK